MDKKRQQQAYENYVKQKTPVHNLPANMTKAFVTGGAICVLGQGILNICEKAGLDKDISGGWCSMLLVFLSAVLTGFNVYPRIAKWGGAGALVDAEAVLLVGDDETEVLILHIRREQGVRADDEGKLAGAECFIQGAALPGPGRGGEQRAGDAEGHEQRRERAVVLLGEDLGRRHEGALKTVFRGHVNGGGSDHRFA